MYKTKYCECGKITRALTTPVKCKECKRRIRNLTSRQVWLEKFYVKFGIGKHEKLIAIPAGDCWVPKKENLENWIEDLFWKGRSENVVFMPSAISYWAVQLYGYNSENHKKIKKYLEENYENV